MTPRSAAATLLTLAALPLSFAARVIRGGAAPGVALDLDVRDLERDLFTRNDDA